MRFVQPGRCRPAIIEAASWKRLKEKTMSPKFDLQQLGHANIERALAFQTSALQTLQAATAEVTDHAKVSIEQGTAAFEQLAKVKTLDKAIELQTAYAKSAFEGLVARGKKIGELYAGLAKEAFKPYTA
jgi:hypothetical protein